MNNIFDSHGHYTESAFDDDRQILLNSLPKKGVKNIVTVAAAMEDCPKILKLVSEYDYIYGALGVHPDELGKRIRISGFCLFHQIFHKVLSLLFCVLQYTKFIAFSFYIH